MQFFYFIPFEDKCITSRILVKVSQCKRDQDLAYRFGVHQSTISRRFKIWIEVMFVWLKPMIKWPDRAVVTKTLPMVFRSHFKRCICIIDCFEVFCENQLD